MTDASPVILLLVALIAGGGVGFYMARANKDSINVGSSEKAVKTLETVLDRLDEDLAKALERIGGLETELAQTKTLLADQHDVVHECRTRIDHLSAAIARLGGSVDDGDDVRDGGDRA